MTLSEHGRLGVRCTFTAGAILLLVLAIDPPWKGGPVASLACGAIGLAIALVLSGAWLDVGVGLFVALVVIAGFQAHDGHKLPLAATTRLSLPAQRVRVVGDVRPRQQAILIAMVRDAHGATVHTSEHAVTVIGDPPRGRTIVSVDRSDHNVALDSLLADLADSTVYYLVANSHTAEQPRPGEEEDEQKVEGAKAERKERHETKQEVALDEAREDANENPPLTVTVPAGSRRASR